MLRSFMAVTAHFINARGELKEHLIAFRKIDGQHSGANVGQVLFSVLEEHSILTRVSAEFYLVILCHLSTCKDWADYP